jgi:hypothetical protein
MEVNTRPRFTAQQQKAAELIAGGLSHEKAAMQVGVTGRTIRDWLSKGLRAEVDRLSKESQGQAVQILSGLLRTAAVTLGELMRPEHPDSIRLSAARGVFDEFVAMRQYIDLAAELHAIKARLDAEGIGRNGRP